MLSWPLKKKNRGACLTKQCLQPFEIYFSVCIKVPPWRRRWLCMGACRLFRVGACVWNSLLRFVEIAALSLGQRMSGQVLYYVGRKQRSCYMQSFQSWQWEESGAWQKCLQQDISWEQRHYFVLSTPALFWFVCLVMGDLISLKQTFATRYRETRTGGLGFKCSHCDGVDNVWPETAQVWNEWGESKIRT